MSLLTQPLPQTVCGLAADTDFRAMLRFEQLLREDIPEETRMLLALNLFYREPPPDLPAAVSGLLWFYRGGEEDAGDADSPSPPASSPRSPAYDFEQDAGFIYAAFLEQYRIDLTETAYLHWWKFRALLHALREDCAFMKLVGYRTADTRRMKGEQKAFYQRMQKLCRVKSRASPEPCSVDGYNRSMLDYVSRRFREAEKTAAPERSGG